jgi:hypothetical protein
MAGPNRRIKAPNVFQGTPGAPGTPYAKSSRKKPVPTGMDPGSPSYGAMDSGSAGNTVAKMNSMFGSGNRDLTDNQDQLESKTPRSFCK